MLKVGSVYFNIVFKSYIFCIHCFFRFESGRWYFVEITWHPASGLKLFIDNEQRGETEARVVTSNSLGSFYIGRPNQGDVPSGRYSNGNFDIDEMEIWYGDRENLLAFGYINRGMFIF